jgi:hypothetical protein
MQVPQPKISTGRRPVAQKKKRKKEKKKKEKENGACYIHHPCFTFDNLHGGNFHNEFP